MFMHHAQLKELERISPREDCAHGQLIILELAFAHKISYSFLFINRLNKLTITDGI